MAPVATNLPAESGAAGDWKIDQPGFAQRLRAGEGAAFELLVREQTPRLMAVIGRLLGQDSDTSDALQDTFMRIFQNIEQFAGEARLSTWIHRIAVNSALMKLRKQSRRDEVSIDQLLPAFDGHGKLRYEHLSPWKSPETVTDLVLRREMKQQVRRQIDRLPENYRTVLILRDIEELDTEETARLLEIQPGAVKTRLHRARLALRALLEPLLQGDEP
ncbi:MAG: sigma-70 family RNA polymerase sigma factor [Phycisphaeraceae bacterium]|nr:sigma-70 family RNA polymerase sigma factor [Phycisphaeraceae bacterium]